jgi:hypothetical protein
MSESELSKNLRNTCPPIGGKAKLRLDTATVFRDAEKLASPIKLTRNQAACRRLNN